MLKQQNDLMKTKGIEELQRWRDIMLQVKERNQLDIVKPDIMIKERVENVPENKFYIKD